MRTIEPDPDLPVQNDWTLKRLEMIEAFDQFWPGFSQRLATIDCQREGTPIGHVVEPGSGPAGVMLHDFGADKQVPDAGPLAWHAKRGYLILRAPEAPELWVRALRAYPATYQVEAVLLTRLIEPDRGVRRWHAHDAEDQPVLLAGPRHRRPAPAVGAARGPQLRPGARRGTRLAGLGS
jgi:hypothetical protein